MWVRLLKLALLFGTLFFSFIALYDFSIVLRIGSYMSRTSLHGELFFFYHGFFWMGFALLFAILLGIVHLAQILNQLKKRP